MDTPALIIILGILLFFGLIVYGMFASGRKESERKRQMAQALGFTPIEPEASLTATLSQLYQSRKAKSRYELRHVSRKTLPEGELVLFDLVETSGEADSYPEQQAVAVISPHLNLPPFMIFPKADIEGQLSDLANRMLHWVVSKVETAVEFPEAPEFQWRYIVTSPEPEATRRFLNENNLRQLAQTRLYAIHAGGKAFSFSHLDPSRKRFTAETLRERVNQAQALYKIFSPGVER
jgi:hypothetical protein